MIVRIAPPVLCACALLASPVKAANLIVNGSFEDPPLNGVQEYRNWVPGETGLTGWEIIGSGAAVSQLRSDFAGNPGWSFPAQDGVISMDLAGYSSNAPVGIRQTIATTIGSVYLLSFWVGNVSGGPFGYSSTIGVEFSSSGTDFSCTNDTQTRVFDWKQCTASFAAASNQTALTFRNLDSNSDFVNALDNVSVSLAPTGGVPEPAAWLMLIAGFGAVGAAMRKHRICPPRRTQAAANARL